MFPHSIVCLVIYYCSLNMMSSDLSIQCIKFHFMKLFYPAVLKWTPVFTSARTFLCLFPPEHLPHWKRGRRSFPRARFHLPLHLLPLSLQLFHRCSLFTLASLLSMTFALWHDFCCSSTSGMRSDRPLGWHMPRSRHFSIMSSVAVSAPCSLSCSLFFFLFHFMFDCLPLFCVPRRLWCFLAAFDIKERLPPVCPYAFSHHTWLSSSFVPHGYFQQSSLGFLSSFSSLSSSSCSSSDVPHF